MSKKTTQDEVAKKVAQAKAIIAQAGDASTSGNKATCPFCGMKAKVRRIGDAHLRFQCGRVPAGVNLFAAELVAV